uniref:Ion transport domain-containing protein n=1 Tax=Prymnesium polylepis TaxID=72548 RepID=A0A7S4I858_9EUKA|mmetsp:Transcript_27932/g.69013  ORF Transcript_27932/g.69013 Transcript_27932/m.69013 type:complete len:279 (+) Transcript_27932:3-839(+)
MLVWPKAVGVARGSERLSFLNDVIVTTVLDMPAFMLIMAFIMALFGFSFALLTRFKTAEFGTILRIAFTVWNLQLGDYEQDLYLANNSMTSFFFGYTFLVNIVCLNVLIALMGDSWEKTQEKAKARGLQKKAELIVDLEQGLDHTDSALFPAWIHCVQPEQADGGDDDADAWQGRIVALRKDITAASKANAAKVDTVKAKVEAVEAKVGAVEASVGAKVDAVKATMGAVEAKVDAVEAKVEAKMNEIKGMLEQLLANAASSQAAIEATEVRVTPEPAH